MSALPCAECARWFRYLVRVTSEGWLLAISPHYCKACGVERDVVPAEGAPAYEELAA